MDKEAPCWKKNRKQSPYQKFQSTPSKSLQKKKEKKEGPLYEYLTN